MNQQNQAPEPQRAANIFDPFQILRYASEYTQDAWQRAILYSDVRRQRGNQYRAHLQEASPNVLSFPSTLIMSGLELPQPVNYGLVRITPLPNTPVEPGKRPFIVVDPRAGHGPGIGGFKPDSEIGAALQAGHPCYFVGFLPDPVPGQSIEDVMRAEAAFVRKVAELHPESEGRPAVIGNCQAGWQILMTAAVWPELFGPIILAGAPVSYWAGDNPMRYAGGLLGGSWLTAMTSDMGKGRFDGAWLVQNFENLNPSNTLWSKQYKVYSHVDTEGPRYLEFEKYWGGYVFLEDKEIQYIVDNLFIGNKLTTGELRTSDGIRIDLRNITSPIVVFCSYGDNITPPAQALGWITDLYKDDEDVLCHDQTIVYATHDSIGHLGIFVSGSVGRKEHRKFTANIDIINMLPAGIYRAEVNDTPSSPESPDPQADKYLMTLRRSGVQEVHSIVQPDPDSERRFAAAAKISEINLALYRNLFQPWVQAWSTPESARYLQAMHPLRLSYEWWSDLHPMAPVVEKAASKVRDHRVLSAADNPFWAIQEFISKNIVDSLDLYRDVRDAWYANTFKAIYGSPAAQALAGQSWQDSGPVRPHPGETPEHCAFLQAELNKLDADQVVGGLPEAVVRALCIIFYARGEADERHFHHAWEAVKPYLSTQESLTELEHFRSLVRYQALLLHRDAQAGLAAIPTLLAQTPVEQIRDAAQSISELVQRAGDLSEHEEKTLKQVLSMFHQQARQADTKTPKPKATKTTKPKTR